MQYNQFGKLGNKSRLGLGTMRLPVNADGSVNEDEAIRLIRLAIDGGINYVDTAYPYHGGASEVTVGKALKDGYREKVTLTTKLPCWKVEKREDMDAILDEQLRRLDLPYVDMYLLHALDIGRYRKMRELGYKEFFESALKDGRIRHVGFSFHDGKDAFLEIIDDFDAWEMAQIQFNYLDDESQATEAGLKYAGRKNIPIVVMEPLRGGNLAALPGNVRALTEAYPVKRGAVEWAFRYVADYEEVKVILSGMSTVEQVKENLKLFEVMKPGNLSDSDRALLRDMKADFLSRQIVPCTGCEYCQPCPKGVKIPDIFSAVNQASMFERQEAFEKRYARMKEREGDASRCIHCGKCEKACPQGIPIRKFLDAVNEGRIFEAGAVK